MERHLARVIAGELDNLVSRADEIGGRKAWTAAIIDALSRLGEEEFGYIVARRGNWEWLHDISWLDYHDFDRRLLRKLVLAVESEWETDAINLRVDFNKLLVANAQLCVMIFQDSSRNSFDIQMELFIASISAYSEIPSGYMLFSCYINGSGEFRHVYVEYGAYGVRKINIVPWRR